MEDGAIVKRGLAESCAEQLPLALSLTSERAALIRQAFRLKWMTVAWMVVEGVVAIAAGLAAGSLTLMAARARERKRWAARCKGSSGAVASGLRRSGALTCFEFVRDHGIAHASRKAAREDPSRPYVLPAA
jgi:hypothetical protein